ncbi:MAG TPA: glycosyltransferase family 4 protein [Chitinophagaceae bacterium]|nr:glycosyltransferase family 4 protein [Chitinophagaceae bacterium]
MKLAIVITHPIQYYAPLFKLLTARGNIQLKVFYTWERGAEKFDVGFGKSFDWDIPLLEGYDHTFVSNKGNRKKGFWDVHNPSLNTEIAFWKPDAVLVYGWNYRSHLRAMRHFSGKATVLFRGDSTLLDKGHGTKELLRRSLLKWIYKPVDIALYVGSNNKEYFREYGLQENQLMFAPHSIDNDRFTNETPAHIDYRGELLRSLSIPAQAKKILFTGKFQSKKNPVLLMKAFLQLNDPGVHLLMVGNGEQEQQLKELAADHPNIHFLPFQNQSMMPAVYRLGDVFCLPSQGPGETWGLAVNEAMACGKAILVSDKTGCAIDLVKNGENGYIFESNNLQDLTSKLKALLAADYANMGKESLKIIKDWSFERQAQCIEDALFSKRVFSDQGPTNP